MREKVTIRDILRPLLVPIHNEAWVFVFIFAGVSLLLFFVHDFLGYLGLVLTAWCLYFFRDPVRFTPLAEGIVVSPADGVVQRICDSVPPAELGDNFALMRRVSIFMNAFNVHINRVPMDGEVVALAYREGRFFSADLDKASHSNERRSFALEGFHGERIVVVQIAGLLARRIVCGLRRGSRVLCGERFGLIRFGSRVDVYLPPAFEILCAEGQTMVGGETILARFSGADNESLSPPKVIERGYISGYRGRRD